MTDLTEIAEPTDLDDLTDLDDRSDRSGSADGGDDGSVAEQFRVHRAVVIDPLVEPPIAEFLSGYLHTLIHIGVTTHDPVMPDISSVYAAPAFETLLAALTGPLSEMLEIDLLPTYSFARLYRAGQELRRHSDRPACEISVSVTLGSESGDPWALCAESPTGVVACATEPGGALVYRGNEVEHWREPLARGWHAQAFLHWVDANGPFASQVFDGRPTIGGAYHRGDEPDRADGAAVGDVAPTTTDGLGSDEVVDGCCGGGCCG